jgi:hypothetical protein
MAALPHVSEKIHTVAGRPIHDHLIKSSKLLTKDWLIDIEDNYLHASFTKRVKNSRNYFSF